ncbi:glycosyltransferase family protein [Rummeliibacillus suwonensis]|uniref:glycosyltransferase family protein n=1 Tax=Rummeliibacillus suwonensis TaxID=1306154 RepID=UPI0011B4088A|nr:glycosyltransferase [Rummeliibacillus suwonensis]MBO2534274.1 glycosyltransferase family 1 protein [Rummeliibacillus suwonensis]
MKKVILLSGKSQYDVMTTWLLEIEKSLIKNNVEYIRMLDYNLENFSPKILENVDLIIGLNGWYVREIKKNNYLRRIPYCLWLADHPIDHVDRIKCLESNDILTVMDKKDFDFVRFLDIPCDTYFMPHAAFEISPIIFEKELDVLFLGSYPDKQKYINGIKKLDIPVFNKIVEYIFQQCINDDKMYYFDLFKEIMRQSDVNLQLEENEYLMTLARYIGRIINAHRRIETLKNVANSGIKLNIFGNKWENSELFNHPNINFYPAVNYIQAQDLMKMSKITLNIQGLLYDGSHERVYSGMANGSVTVTNRTPFLEGLFIENKEIIFYDFDKQNIVEKIKYVLNNDDIREEISQNGRMAIIGKHTYNERVQHLINIYNDRFNINP